MTARRDEQLLENEAHNKEIQNSSVAMSLLWWREANDADVSEEQRQTRVSDGAV